MFENNSKMIIVTGPLRSWWTLNKQKLSWKKCLFKSKLTTCLSVTDSGVLILLCSQLLLKLKSRRSWDPGDTFSQQLPKAAAEYRGEQGMLRGTMTAHSALIPAGNPEGQAPGTETFQFRCKLSSQHYPHEQCWCDHNSAQPRRVTVGRGKFCSNLMNMPLAGFTA